MNGTTPSATRRHGLTPVTPTRFWQAFRAVSSGRYVTGGRHWRPSSRTRELLDREISLPGQESGLLWLLAQNLELDYRREFFGYDVIYYTGEVERDRWTAPANIAVVLEHENDPNTSHHEISRLSLTTIPLKVLITYPEDFGHTGDVLESYLRVLDDSGAAVVGQLMVIFGVPGGRARAADWIAYTYGANDNTFDFFEVIP